MGEATEVRSGLAAAVAAFQGAISIIGRDRDVEVKSDKGRYTFRYATLAALWKVARAPLAANGLALLQSPEVVTDGARTLVRVTTTLRHVSGEQEVNVLALPVAQVTPQGIGSAISYARRYAMGALLGLASEDEDDDGAAAAGNETAPRSMGRPPPTPPRKATQGAPVSAAELEQQMASCRTVAELSKVGARVKDAGLDAAEQARLRGIYNARATELRGVPS
jgi:hypothetical protein